MLVSSGGTANTAHASTVAVLPNSPLAASSVSSASVGSARVVLATTTPTVAPRRR